MPRKDIIAKIPSEARRVELQIRGPKRWDFHDVVTKGGKRTSAFIAEAGHSLGGLERWSRMNRLLVG